MGIIGLMKSAALELGRYGITSMRSCRDSSTRPSRDMSRVTRKRSLPRANNHPDRRRTRRRRADPDFLLAAWRALDRAGGHRSGSGLSRLRRGAHGLGRDVRCDCRRQRTLHRVRPGTGVQPIENYGVIGGMRSIALVSVEGSIDFLCYPDFDSPTIFAALLDPERGGSFALNPECEDMRAKQLYLPNTNILLTRLLSEKGVAEITDFMPVGTGRDGQKQRYGHHIIRVLRVIKGECASPCAARRDSTTPDRPTAPRRLETRSSSRRTLRRAREWHCTQPFR